MKRLIRRNTIYLWLVFALSLSQGCQQQHLRSHATDALIVLQDEKNPINKRIDAAFEIGGSGDKAFVKPMIQLLPGHWDALTHEIILSLGKIGDRRAIPILEKMRDDQTINIPGRTLLAINWAIEQCNKKARGGTQNTR